MSSSTKLLLLFIAGLAIGTFLFTTKPLPINNRLPDLIFPKTSSPISIIFTGDVMLGRSVNTRIRKYADPTWPMKNVASLLSEADITIINLESPFLSGCRPTDTGMVFCADPKNVAALVLAGVDYASIANNHINNQGSKGIEDTISTLNSNKITPVGKEKTEYLTIKNSIIAILSFSDLPQMNEIEMARQVSESLKSADIIITTFHWGVEYTKTPTARQIFLAHLAIDSGADIVVGHHPHWVQTEEIYMGKPIFYSLGNLIFDQMWSEETRLGQILKVTFRDNVLIKKEITLIKIFDYGQPALSYITSDLK